MKPALSEVRKKAMFFQLLENLSNGNDMPLSLILAINQDVF